MNELHFGSFLIFLTVRNIDFVLRFNLNSTISRHNNIYQSSLDGRPQPTSDNSQVLPESLPDFNGCPSDIIIIKVDGELETPSTLYTPTASSFVSG